MQKGLVAGFFIGLGVALTGFLLSQALNNHTYYNRSISVKGLSERDVIADLGQWTLTFKTTGNSVKQASLVIEEQRGSILAGLLSAGFSADEINAKAPISVEDLMVDRYNGYDPKTQSRYVLKTSIVLETKQVEKLFKNTDLVNKFVGLGIVFTGKITPSFFYSSLNDVKPAMLQEAGQNAYAAALELAKNTQSKIGKIKSASQGSFSIRLRTEGDGYEGGNEKESPYLRVRVVTNTSYFIAD